MAVAANESVTADQIMIRLQSEEAELAVEQAADELNRATAVIERAKAILAKAKSSAGYRREDLERHEKLGKSISDAERRGLQEAVDNAEVEHVVAYNDFLQTQHLAQISELRLRAAQLRLQRMHIAAPITGEITRTMVDIGERVELGQTVVELRTMEHRLADFQVPEETTELTQLIGQAVQVNFEVAGQRQTLSGRVVSTDSEVNARGMVRVHVKIENEKRDGRWLLFHGKSVSLSIVPSTETQLVNAGTAS